MTYGTIIDIDRRKVSHMGAKKQQSPEDMIVTLARALSGSTVAEIPEKVFRDAALKVGHSERQRLEWAIQFAQQPDDGNTPFDWQNAQLETGAFLHPWWATAERSDRSLPFSGVMFPSVAQLKNMKAEFLELLRVAHEETGLEFPVPEMTAILDKNGLRYQIAFNLSDPAKHATAQLEKAKLELAQLLARHWGYIGLCDRKRHGCGRYFLKSRMDREFCSKTCVNRSTTYRQRGKEPTP
jgi:hypothetical protein